MRFIITALDPGAVPGISTKSYHYGDETGSTGPKKICFTQNDTSVKDQKHKCKRKFC